MQIQLETSNCDNNTKHNAKKKKVSKITSQTLKFLGQTLAAAVQEQTHQNINHHTTLTALTKLKIYQVLNVSTACCLFDPPKHTNPLRSHLIFRSDSN